MVRILVVVLIGLCGVVRILAVALIGLCSVARILVVVFCRVGHAFFSKERNILEFFCVLYKRTQRSLRSFAFFIKESSVFCVLLRSF